MLQRGSSVGSVVGGLVGSGDLLVTYGGSGLNVSVAAGECVVPGSSSSSQGGYYLLNTSALTLTPASASASNPRIDLVSASIADAAYTGSSNLGSIQISTGTPTGGASLANLSGAPSLPTSSLALAYVLIPQSATTISNSDILNENTFLYFGPSTFNTRGTAGAIAANSGDFVSIAATGSSTVTLPAPFKNAKVKVENPLATAAVTVQQHASEVIYGLGMSGVASFTLSSLGACVELLSDGTNWFVTAGMQDSGWQTFNYLNGWASGGGPATGATAAGYRLQGNVVECAGWIQSGVNGAVSMILPARYRPTSTVYPATFMLGGGAIICAWVVSNTGAMTPNYVSSTDPGLGFQFTVD
jgi:hypothetical protein